MVKVHYDSTTGAILGFYPDDIEYTSLPDNYIEIGNETHIDCINNQGKRKVDITTLTLIECELPKEDPLISIRAERDRRLNETAWVFMRQLTGTSEQKLSDADYQKWVAYWALLRDLSDTCDPENVMWPVAPNEEVYSG